jgi:hypothetical protein
MNAREQARFDMIKRVGTFGANHTQDFVTPVAPSTKATPAQTKAKQLFEDLNTPGTGLIAKIQENAGAQQSGTGEFRGGATSKSVLRDALFLELKGINRTAAAIAAEQKKPEIMDKFRMPYAVSDVTLTAKATAIADAAQSMTDDFLGFGHDATFVDDLRAHIAAFQGADTAKDTGRQSQAGATAQFVPLLEEAMTKVRQLDAFMHNFYRSNAGKMGEWHTASHTERQGKKKEESAPAAPAPSGASGPGPSPAPSPAPPK